MSFVDWVFVVTAIIVESWLLRSEILEECNDRINDLKRRIEFLESQRK